MKYTDLIKQVFTVKENEIGSLNGLRSAAIILVLMHHIQPLLKNIPNVNPLIENFFGNTVSGVDIFFILSGYLISKELQNSWKREGRIDFKDFFLKRSFRIFPAYYFFLIISLIAYKVMLKAPQVQSGPDYGALLEIYQKWPMDFLYMTDYIKGIHVHTWSLSVEEKYYLILPFFMHFFYFRLGKTHRLIVLAALYFIPLLARLYTFYSTDLAGAGLRIYYTHYPLHARFDALIAGIIIMELHTNWDIIERIKKIKLIKPSFYIFSAIILFLSHSAENKVNSIFFQVLCYNGFNLGYSLVFLLCLDTETAASRIMGFRVFTPIARLSYSIYLWHFLVFVSSANGSAVFRKISQNQPISWIEFGLIAMYGFVSVTVWSFFSYSLIEAPFLYLREKIRKKA
ncbi:MAG TPA: acyltransferase [Leptospiraceae bacterium]|nr:acyltransferase [Leptospiraceae bacterium]HMZ58332.1 acyltransferase [Leptospiraceae bacterium]HNF16387.1 acyltransferase [Leptospiraceae bacterium]HNF27057.1 acyltransferase [Leptospiraceae bacterium]HNN07273.1 acyltransferase [Leptospiraceae bacterium]